MGVSAPSCEVLGGRRWNPEAERSGLGGRCAGVLWRGLAAELLGPCQRHKEIDLLKNEERPVLALAAPDLILHTPPFWQGERLLRGLPAGSW